VTTPICIIYLLEILNACCTVSDMYVASVQISQILESIAFSAHWIALGVFTAEYIRVATQIPLLRAKPVFGWFPIMLYILIAGTCAFFICAGYYVN
jgi:hypothetical protein